MLFGVGQIGCSPNALANSPDGRTCIQRYNSANQMFNNRLRALVDQLNANQPDARFIYIDSFGIFQDIINSPSSFGNKFFQISLLFLCFFLKSHLNNEDIFDMGFVFWMSGGAGFRVTNAGCCGVGRNNGQITCLPFQTPCPNRREYLFWDAFHPTEAGNTVVGRRAYSAQRPSDAYPIDIRRLAQL